MKFTPPQINEQEALDDPKLPLELRKEYLLELDRTNRLLGVYKTVLKEFLKLAAAVVVLRGNSIVGC